MEIRLCWYQKGANNTQTYDLRDHLMVDLETNIALTSMTHIVDLDGCQLHLGVKKTFNNFIMNARVLHYTYDRDSL